MKRLKKEMRTELNSILHNSNQAKPSTEKLIDSLIDSDEEKEVEYKEGEIVDIPVRTKHRVENKTNEDLIFIETQTGTYFGEDDIVRIEDDYGRDSNEN